MGLTACRSVPFCLLLYPSRWICQGAVPAPQIAAKKEAPRRKAAFTIPPALAGGIYLSPATAGDIYFVRADKRGLIKHKRERPNGQAIFTIPPAAAGGIYIYLTPSGVRYYLSPADRPGIIKHKKRKAQRAFLFFEFN